jgi:DNA-directed RNA polymerase I subunit RPA1
MLNILEEICKLVTVREVPGITNCHVVPIKDMRGQYQLQTEGVNFHHISSFDELDLNKISCNDPHSIMEFYGIEAARSSLVNEVNNVFSHYGISVNHRHLFLVGDFMTNHGFLNPMSRAGMQYNTSSLVKMSFETTMKFLTDACLGISGGVSWDKADTPSGRLVLGRSVKNGTGCFDIK